MEMLQLRFYVEKFPNRKVLSSKLFKNLQCLCADSFETRYRDSGRSKSVSAPNMENRILRIEENLGNRMRRMSDSDRNLQFNLGWRMSSYSIHTVFNECKHLLH